LVSWLQGMATTDSRQSYQYERTLGKLYHHSLVLEQSLQPMRVGMVAHGDAHRESPRLESSLAAGRQSGNDTPARRLSKSDIDMFDEIVTNSHTPRDEPPAAVSELFTQRVGETQALNRILLQPHPRTKSTVSHLLAQRDLKETELAKLAAALTKIEGEHLELTQQCRDLTAANAALAEECQRIKQSDSGPSPTPSTSTAEAAEHPLNWPRFAMQALILESGLNWAVHPDLRWVMLGQPLPSTPGIPRSH
jgi:hypothetical protein